MAAKATETQVLMVFDFSTQKWAQITDSVISYPIWSHDGKYLYFKNYPSADTHYQIVRMRPSDHKLENVADPGNVGRLTAGSHGKWFGLAPDNSPLFTRNITTQEIYALDTE
ncbi:MAG: hypothetical protein WBX22_13880 [Silvibacterium sp.]|jgi:Tol biopolymer transport system component